MGQSPMALLTGPDCQKFYDLKEPNPCLWFIKTNQPLPQNRPWTHQRDLLQPKILSWKLDDVLQ